MFQFLKIFLTYFFIGIFIAISFGYEPYTNPFGWCIFITECIGMLHFICVQIFKYLDDDYD